MSDENLSPLRMFGTILHYDDFVKLTRGQQAELADIWASKVAIRSELGGSRVAHLERADELLYRYEHGLLDEVEPSGDQSPLEVNGTILNNAAVTRLTASQQLDLLDIWAGRSPRRSHLSEADVLRLQQGDELLYRYDHSLLSEPSLRPDRGSLAQNGTVLYNAALARLTPTEQEVLLIIWARGAHATSQLNASDQLRSKQTDELVYRYNEGILQKPSAEGNLKENQGPLDASGSNP